MNLQLLYHEYINLKFKRGLPPVQMDGFEYGIGEDGRTALFLTGRDDEVFTDWTDELQPRDPHYMENPDWEPVLSGVFGQMDVYDELIFYYLLFTINSTTNITNNNPYGAMNDFMKNYCFFQLAQLGDVSAVSEEQKRHLRDFFFFFYLYAHPVNEETLYAFSFRGQELVHTKTNIRMERYFSEYHDYYSENLDKFCGQILLSPQEIEACKSLTLELLRSIEGKSAKLTLPPEDGLEDVLRLVNDVDALIRTYSENKTQVFEVMAGFLADNRSSPYRDHGFRTLLQNYVCYILYFQFNEIHHLVDYFKATPAWCGKIINHMFADTIFLQRIMRLKHIDITEYTRVIEFFDEEARRIYL